MKILAIETSCDETAVAIYDSDAGLLGQLIHSQIDLHQKYGGVVPELASRDHIKKLLPLIQQLLDQLKLSQKDISGIAYTRGPGLIGALMVGASVARSLAFAWDIPSIGVHHLESHIMAAMLEKEKPLFPFVTLLVSGGHTLLLYAEKYAVYRILGETLDDAAGEAFDKTAKLLGLNYPGGPALAAIAKCGNAKRFHFPRPMLNRPGLEFSFSGLKTAAINCFQQNRFLSKPKSDGMLSNGAAGVPLGDGCCEHESVPALRFRKRSNDHDDQLKADIACAFEDAVIEVLMKKSERALEAMHCDQLVIAGGVSANEKLREHANKLMKRGKKIFFPQREFCTDNAAMVAINGFMRLSKGEKDTLDVDVKARWAMDEIV